MGMHRRRNACAIAPTTNLSGAAGGTTIERFRDGRSSEETVPARRFDAVFIDFYGTVTDGDRLAVERACRKVVDAFHLPFSPAEFAIRWGEVFFATLERRNHGAFRTLYECEIESLRRSLSEWIALDGMDLHPFVEDIENYWADPPIHSDAVDFLARCPLPICCVSNADTIPLLSAIRKHDLRFDAVVTSEAARSYKPDPAIFRRALQILGVDPSRVIHVGDSLHSDVQGAQAAGISTAWVCRKDRIHDIGTCKPRFLLSSLEELSALL